MQRSSVKRCAWAESHVDHHRYHDEEWGVVVHDDQLHFEYLMLEGAQAGLSWLTILRKRAGYRQAFAKFDPVKISKFTQADYERLLTDDRIVRNRLKIRAAITNAQAFLDVQKEFGSFDRYIWQFVNHQTKVNTFKSLKEVPSKTPEAEAMSRDLKRRGFKFVGPTICYAYMQAVGMVNDHTIDCFRYKEV